MSVTRSADGRCPGLGLALAVIATAQLMVVLRTALPLRVGIGPLPGPAWTAWKHSRCWGPGG